MLSTLHTNDAPGALTRLNEMGVEPFLTGSAVSAVLAQRLARKLCTHCCEMYTPTRGGAAEGADLARGRRRADGMVLYRKRGCPRCNQTGYKGRIGIFQLLVMSERARGSSPPRRRAARARSSARRSTSGMRTLWDDGLAKVAAGLTSLEELARITV